MRDIKFQALHEGKKYDVSTRKPIRADWKGWYKMHGYVMRLVTEHPFANSRGYVAEHRLVYEEYLGNFLPKNAVIHHINRERDDNALDNLDYMPEQARHAKHHDNGVRNSNGQFVAADPSFNNKKFRLFNKNTSRVQVFTLAKLIATTFRSSQFDYRGEFTGLKDRNGVEIYEGDILEYVSPEPQEDDRPDRYVVEWKNYGWEATWQHSHKPDWVSDGRLSLQGCDQDMKVIGNIYEKPELLEESK